MAFIGDSITSVLAGSNPAQQANITQAATQAQANTAFDQTQQGLAQQQAFLAALQGQNGISNQSDVYNQLGQIAAGQGPNPAQAQLAQATQANIANQAALAAGQRGAGANVGILNRQAAMTGGNLQQQAVGQGATMQANQSMGAIQAQGNLATQQVAQQQAAQQAYNQAALQQQSNVIGGITGTNQANVQSQASVNQGATAMKGAALGALSGAGAAMVGAAHGGMMGDPTAGPESMAGKHFHGLMMSEGGMVPVMLSPGEGYIPPSKVDAVAQGAKPESVGKIVPGKAKVKGDDQKNDVVPAKLEKGGVVIPRTVMNSKDDDAASKFVQAVLAKSSLRKGK